MQSIMFVRGTASAQVSIGGFEPQLDRSQPMDSILTMGDEYGGIVCC